jgi:hypothetical protein
MVERRRYMRFDVLFEALCRTGGALKKLKVLNFSREGVGIMSDEMLSPGDDIEVELMIPGDNVPVMMSGTVAWTENDTLDISGFKGGLRFGKIDNPDRSRILDHVYSKWLMPQDE